MKIVQKILAVIMYLVYLFAFSQAVFASGNKDSLLGKEPRLTNNNVLEEISRLPHRCDHLPTAEVVVEVLVDTRGMVRDYRVVSCMDHAYQEALEQMIQRLSFVPAFSAEGIPVQATTTVSILGHVHI